MRNIIFLLPVLLCCTSAAAQEFRIDTVRDVSPFYTREPIYSFLILSSDTKQSVADSINRHLMYDMLRIRAEEVDTSIFENIWGSSDLALPILTGLSFNIFNNDSNTFSLAISAEWCGPHCYYFTNYYNYSSKTGQHIEIPDLLTSEGMTQLLHILTEEKRRIVNNFIPSIKDSLHRADTLDKDYYSAMITFYEDCLTSLDMYGPYYDNFCIQDQTITITLGCGSGHYGKIMDKLGNFQVTLDLQDWYPLLSDLGKELFSVYRLKMK